MAIQKDSCKNPSFLKVLYLSTWSKASFRSFIMSWFNLFSPSFMCRTANSSLNASVTRSAILDNESTIKRRRSAVSVHYIWYYMKILQAKSKMAPEPGSFYSAKVSVLLLTCLDRQRRYKFSDPRSFIYMRCWITKNKHAHIYIHAHVTTKRNIIFLRHCTLCECNSRWSLTDQEEGEGVRGLQ